MKYSLFHYALSSCLLISANLANAQTKVIINEVDADQSGADAAEFIELYDGGNGNTSLDGLIVVFVNGNNDSTYEAFDLTGFSTNALGYFVLGNPAVPNVDLPFDPGASGALQNGPDAVALYQASIDAFPSGTPVTSANLVDALVYGTNDPDDSSLLSILTPNGVQVNDTATEAMARIPDGGEAGDTNVYLNQAPTPGVSNLITSELRLSVEPATVSEAAGSDAVTVTVERTGSTDGRLTISLSNNDPTEIAMPTSVELAAGEATATFTITVINDAWADGTQTATLIASALGFIDGFATVEIADDDGDVDRLVINEIYADDQEDANQDGEGMTDAPGFDEYVEIVNVSSEIVDLSNYTLSDSATIRHLFTEGTQLDPGCGLLVFGGGEVAEGHNALFGGALVLKANGANSFGLGLDNAGDTVSLQDPTGIEVTGAIYGSVSGIIGSMNRDPDLTGTAYHPHIDVDATNGYIYSPGFRIDSTPFCEVAATLTLTADVEAFAEDAGPGAATLTVERSGATNEALRVTLHNSDPTELSLPESIDIPAGESRSLILIDAIDDRAQDDVQSVIITASAPGFVNGQLTFSVMDDADEPVFVVINEVDSDQPGDEIGEFVELYDGGIGNTPLDGLILVLYNGNNLSTYDSIDLAQYSTNSKGFFVVGDPEVPNVNLAINNFNLQNGPDGVAIYRAAPEAIPQGSFVTAEALIDAVIYGTEDEPVTDLLDILTPGELQINEGPANNENAIARVPDGGERLKTATFFPQPPSPGRSNGAAPPETYHAWATTFENLGTSDEDPDSDGIANIFEYAWRLDPLKPDLNRTPTIPSVGDDVFQFSYLEPSSMPPDVIIDVQHSLTLTDDWASLPNEAITIDRQSNGDGTDRVIVNIATQTEAPLGFIRLSARSR